MCQLVVDPSRLFVLVRRAVHPSLRLRRFRVFRERGSCVVFPFDSGLKFNELNC